MRKLQELCLIYGKVISIFQFEHCTCFLLHSLSLSLPLSLILSLSIPLCEKMFKIKLIWPWKTDCWKHSKTDPGQTLPSNKYWIIKQIWLGTRSRTKRSPVRLPQVCILKENLPFGPMCFSGWGIYLLNIWGCVNHIRLGWFLCLQKTHPDGKDRIEVLHFTQWLMQVWTRL